MGLLKPSLLIIILSTSCGYSDDNENKLNQNSKNEAEAKSAGLSADDLSLLSARMLNAGASELRKNQGAAYFEQNDSHLLLALPGVVSVFGDYGLPAYDEKPKCNDDGKCGQETQLTQEGWAAFFVDFFRGMEQLKINFRDQDRIVHDKIIDFAINGR
jgi:hypothetical protein